MSVESLYIAEWGNTMVTEPRAHWWQPLHLHYYKMGVGGDIQQARQHRRQ